MVAIVSHDIELPCALADRMLYLDGDRTLEGPPQDVLDSLAGLGLTVFTPGGLG